MPIWRRSRGAGLSEGTLTEAAIAEAVATLRDVATVRERSANILAAVEAGASPHFTVDRARLDDVAQRIAALTARRFPDGRVPVHSRWRHFEAGGKNRKALLDERLRDRSREEIARAQIDLALISVLLDAGAGPDWRFFEDGALYTRSEGLALASWHAFVDGAFSSDAADPYRVDAKALAVLDTAQLAAMFQVRDGNPLVGLEGRCTLLRRLGAALAAQPQRFGDAGRPGRLFDLIAALPERQRDAAALLRLLLDAFSDIWPSGQRFAGVPIGDAWAHPLAGGSGASAGWVPFHKLSQWLTYSLLEPFAWAGQPLGGVEALTALPEYRNGGLLLDAGLIVPRDPAFAAAPRAPADPWVIEWRALTVALLDEVAPSVRALLGRDAQQLPLAALLEGGSWLAGRQIAAELRPGGAPPLRIDSDGTVF